MELLIVVSLLAVLATSAIVLINPISIINRGNDTARRKDLDDAKKMLEQYMTDTGCYPQPTQVCMNGTNTTPCTICTKKQATKFSYFTKDICDPKSASAQYLYQTQKSGALVSACPTWFRIYSVLESAYNAQEDMWGCKTGGCGDVSTSRYGYSYLVGSPGAPNDTVSTSNWFCFTNNDCDNCTPYESCIAISSPCYEKSLYANKDTCCIEHNPRSQNCR